MRAHLQSLGSLLFVFFAAVVLFFSLRAPNSEYLYGGGNRTSQQSLAKLLKNEWVPGHPLYALLMLRDRLAVVTTKDELERSMLFLELGKQRLRSAEILLQRKESGLALSTISKGQVYVLDGGAALAAAPESEQKTRYKVLFRNELISFEEQCLTIKDQLEDSQKNKIDSLLRDISVLKTKLSN